MKIGVSLKIDVSKLDKDRFFHGKNGAIYADVTGFIDVETEDQYGNNGFLTQSSSKEERDAGLKLPIIGNSKVFYKDLAPAAYKAPAVARPANIPSPSQNFQAPPAPLDDNSDLPF